MHVSELTLGTLTWGRDTDAQSAREILAEFLAAGGTTIDTSCTYSAGAAESTIGDLMRELGVRDKLTIITKAGIRATPTGGTIDSSRGTLLRNLEGSLARLGVEAVDVWLVGAHDAHCPADETLSALTSAVQTGKARYIGVSNYPGWATSQLATLAASAQLPLAAVEVEYSLLERGIEREVIPAATAHGLGIFAWGPLGRGVLTGKYRRTIPADSRAASPHLHGFVEPYLNTQSRLIVDALAVAAHGLEVACLDVALAWLRTRSLASAIIGPRTQAHLTQILAGIELELPETILAALTEVSSPHFGYPERR